MDREIETRARFRVIRKLGEGGMGEVWLAHDELLQRQVALKRIRATDGDASLEREARALAALHHPSIVAIHDIVQVDGQQYLAMEFIDGRSLAARLRDGPTLSEDEIRRIGAEIAGALAFAHSHNILHNDVKPSNVLLDRNGKAYLTDFGVAQADRTTASVRGTAAVMGTIAYLAPELFAGARPSPLTDQYALGTTLFEAVAGRPPFNSGAAGVAQRMATAAPALSTLAPHVSEELERTIARALSTNPTKRFPSLDSFAAALRGDGTDKISVSYAAARPARRWKAGVVVAAMATLLLAAVIWRSETTGHGRGAAGDVFAGATTTTPAPPAATATPAEPTPQGTSWASSPAAPTAVPTTAPETPGPIHVIVAPPHPDHAKKGKPGDEHGKDH